MAAAKIVRKQDLIDARKTAMETIHNENLEATLLDISRARRDLVALTRAERELELHAAKLKALERRAKQAPPAPRHVAAYAGPRLISRIGHLNIVG